MQFIFFSSYTNNLNHEAFHSGQDVNSWLPDVGVSITIEMLRLLLLGLACLIWYADSEHAR